MENETRDAGSSTEDRSRCVLFAAICMKICPMMTEFSAPFSKSGGAKRFIYEGVGFLNLIIVESSAYPSRNRQFN
jgi:hypothetical protein